MGYEGMMYQTDMVDWPKNQQVFTLYHTVKPASHVRPQHPDSGGGFTFLKAVYQVPRGNTDSTVRGRQHSELAKKTVRARQLRGIERENKSNLRQLANLTFRIDCTDWK